MRRLRVVQPLNFQEPGFERPLSPLAVARSSFSRPSQFGQKETFGRDGMARHLKLRSAHVPKPTLQRELLP